MSQLVLSPYTRTAVTNTHRHCHKVNIPEQHIYFETQQVRNIILWIIISLLGCMKLVLDQINVQ